ncbi:hypothetical protein [Ruegeria halocynthiae]|uniref:hypothetical protein n=1 Tax=Ruegeria halocynthiae TaxID=985054 RepID=UPI00055EC6F8|nr:hypothetical protein [Ruegeria halocynthiae]
MKEIKAIVYGVGSVGRDLVAPMLDKGVTIVGAIDTNPDLVGRDLGEALGRDPIGVIVKDDADSVLAEVKADVAMVCISTSLEVMEPHISRCLRAGVNVITATDSVAYPWRIAPEAGKRLDQLALENGVSLFSSGFQDAFQINLPLVLAGACHKIDLLEIKLASNLEHTGRAEAEMLGLGLSLEDFAEAAKHTDGGAVAEGKSAYFEAIPADFGVKVVDSHYSIAPVTAPTARYSKLTERHIPEGHLMGIDLVAEMDLEKDIKFRSVMSFYVFEEGQPDLSPVEINIKGTPNMSVKLSDIDIHAHVVLCLVNRIVDVIESRPGLVTNEQMPRPKFRPKAFGSYL